MSAKEEYLAMFPESEHPEIFKHVEWMMYGALQLDEEQAYSELLSFTKHPE